MDYLPPIPDPADGTIRRYVIVASEPRCPRYLDLLHGNLGGQDAPKNVSTVDALRQDARRISDEELVFLLQPGRMPNWRPRLVAAYLIGIGRRTRFRETIGDLLLASEVCFSGQGYCFTLAAFGDHQDAEILIAYLDRYLPRLDLRYDQRWALGALQHVDLRLGTNHADRYLAPDGLWERWTGAVSGQPNVDTYRDLISNLCRV
ncbi:DUF6000 family protein [Plantactinospora sp. ZYX-F-223]|uniref:DUF6000 family protein n=1 Tax=Plantactinospora sp. ZYX-F-223 TaxID=3144103 RepID=UPI0031FD832E